MEIDLELDNDGEDLGDVTGLVDVGEEGNGSDPESQGRREEDEDVQEISITTDDSSRSLNILDFSARYDFPELDNKEYTTIKYLLTNARSLSPKIVPLITCFENFGLDIAIVTESWLASGTRLDEDLKELECGTDLCVIYKNRPVRATSRRRTAGGGVAIIYNQTKCSFKEKRIARNNFELVCARGKQEGMDRILVIVGIYVEPRMTAGRLAEFLSLLEDLILQEKAASNNPLFIIAGDVNKRDFSPAFADYVDFNEVEHGPTRGNEKLDKIWTNQPLEQVHAGTLPPIETDMGIKSDHRCVVAQLWPEREKRFVWQRVWTRKKSRQGNERFGELVEGEDWDKLFEGLTPTQMVEALHNKFKIWVDLCFPMKLSRRRSNEDPWITAAIRRKIRIRLKIFLKEGRSARWKRINREIRLMIKKSKREYVNKAVEKCKATGNNSGYYRAAKELNTKARSVPWHVGKVFPGKSDSEVASLVLQYFGSVSDLLPALDASSVPKDCYTDPIPLLQRHEVKKMLSEAKKPSSMVDGDIFPYLYNMFDLSGAAMPIFNAIIATGSWPDPWKTETITVIPKVQTPTDLSQCRNISCTNFLSKVM